MARIAGVDIPRDKRVVVSLTYIYGIGATTAKKICEATGISEDTRVKDLTEEEEGKITFFLSGSDKSKLLKLLKERDKIIGRWLASPNDKEIQTKILEDSRNVHHSIGHLLACFNKGILVKPEPETNKEEQK